MMVLALIFPPAKQSQLDVIFNSQPKDYQDVADGLVLELKKVPEIDKIQNLKEDSCTVFISSDHETKSDVGCSTVFASGKKSGVVVVVTTAHTNIEFGFEKPLDETTQNANIVIISTNKDVNLPKSSSGETLTGGCSYSNKNLSCDVLANNLAISIRQKVKSEEEVR